jgi:two-component system KDP operon response regulator KdpE
MKKTRVLVVDDDPIIQQLVGVSLRQEGYEVLTVSSGKATLQLLSENKEAPNLIILDIKMPEMDGIEVCRYIRTFSKVPIIMLTALKQDEDMVRSITGGADDYITKPFSVDVLLARVQALLRRTKWSDESASSIVCSDDLIIDFMHHKVTKAGKEVILTNTEYQLLSFLAVNCGRVLTQSQCLEEIWGWDYEGNSHNLKVVISRLREKIGDNVHNQKHIATRPGIGYIFLKPG